MTMAHRDLFDDLNSVHVNNNLTYVDDSTYVDLHHLCHNRINFTRGEIVDEREYNVGRNGHFDLSIVNEDSFQYL